MKGLEEFIDTINRRWAKAKKTINENIDKELEMLGPKDPPKQCQAKPDVRVGWLTKTDKVTRVEVIDERGRSYVNWKTGNKVKVAFQDDGRTIKIFINTIK
jgi:hypothetical protein